MSDSETFTITTDPLDGLPINLPETMKVRPLAKTIIAEVAAAHDVTTAELLGPRRFKRLVEPRRIAMIRIREELGYSFPRIGQIFDRDHSSIIWNVRGGRPGQPPRRFPRSKKSAA